MPHSIFALIALLLAPSAYALTPSQTARVLGGLPVEPEVTAQLPARAIADYTDDVDEWWTEFDERIGVPMTAWALSELAQTAGTVFYPFAGADFTTIHRMYPSATRYVLIALEPAGRMPELTASTADTEVILQVFTAMMQEFHRRGYFITGELEAQFSRRQTPLEGITPVLAMTAEREGFEVLSVEPVRVADDGSDVVPHEGDRNASSTWRSVRIQLSRRSDGAPVILDYLKLDLSDEHLHASPTDAAFVTMLSAYPVLVKAASYLLQYESFSFVRQAILDHAPSIVQDDSGIDYTALAQRFDVRLFGEFERPHYEFMETLQASLAMAYDAEGIPDLPFRFGYWKDGLWCLQHAHRRR